METNPTQACMDGRQHRRVHSEDFKAKVVASCMQPGVSKAAVAKAMGINAGLLGRWVREAQQGRNATQADVPVAHGVTSRDATTGFVSIQWPAKNAVSDIRIELRHGATCDRSDLARRCKRPVRGLDARAASMIRINAMWLATQPVNMRAGADRLVARVVEVFGAVQAHHGDLFANARGTRVKLVSHDGFGVWCAVRRLNQVRFVWSSAGASALPALTQSHQGLSKGTVTELAEALRAVGGTDLAPVIRSS